MMFGVESRDFFNDMSVYQRENIIECSEPLGKMILQSIAVEAVASGAGSNS